MSTRGRGVGRGSPHAEDQLPERSAAHVTLMRLLSGVYEGVDGPRIRTTKRRATDFAAVRSAKNIRS